MDYSGLAATANSLIAEYGGSVTLTQTSLGGTYSTLTHSYTKTTKTSSCKGVSKDHISSILPGSLAVGSDEDFILPASLAVTPAPNDVMTFNSTTFYIDKVSPVAPGGTTLMYKIWVKG